MTIFQESEFSVTRQHEEFIWLHERYNENEEYAGLIVTSLRLEIIDFFNIQYRFHQLHHGQISIHLVLNYKN